MIEMIMPYLIALAYFTSGIRFLFVDIPRLYGYTTHKRRAREYTEKQIALAPNARALARYYGGLLAVSIGLQALLWVFIVVATLHFGQQYK